MYSQHEYIYENIIPINENTIGTKDIQVDIISIGTIYSKRVFLLLHSQDINKLKKSITGMIFLNTLYKLRQDSVSLYFYQGIDQIILFSPSKVVSDDREERYSPSSLSVQVPTFQCKVMNGETDFTTINVTPQNTNKSLKSFQSTNSKLKETKNTGVQYAFSYREDF